MTFAFKMDRRHARMKANGYQWTPEQDAELERLHLSGVSDRQIAVRFGVSVGMVGNRRKRLAIYRPDPKTRPAKKGERRCLSCRKPFPRKDDLHLCDSCRRYASENAHMAGMTG